MTSVLLSVRGTCDPQGMAGPPSPLGSGQGSGPFLFNLGCSLVGPKERLAPQQLVHLRQRPCALEKQVLLGKGLWMEQSAHAPRADPCQPAPSASLQSQEWTVLTSPARSLCLHGTPEVTARVRPEQPPCLITCYVVWQEPTGFSHGPGAQPCGGFRKRGWAS